MSVRTHVFHAVAFVENLSIKDLASAFPNGRHSPLELYVPLDKGGHLFIYPFGAVVFCDADEAARKAEIAGLHRLRPGLTMQIVREQYSVTENPSMPTGADSGVMNVDRLTHERLSVISLTVAQSVAMEYYETQVERLFAEVSIVEDVLESTGKVPFSTRRLHRLVGLAIATRSEIVSVLHLLDKPDATWEDPTLDEIYDDLKAEFELGERYEALEHKVDSVLTSLQMVLDVARDRRMYYLEAAIVLLIIVEILLGLLRPL